MGTAYYRETIALMIAARERLGLAGLHVDHILGGGDGYTACLEATASAMDDDPRRWMRQATWRQLGWWSEALAVRPALILDPARLTPAARRLIRDVPAGPVRFDPPSEPIQTSAAIGRSRRP